MTPISLMPPVDYCPSCEGQKAQDHAAQIGEARAKQVELKSDIDAARTPPADDAGQAIEVDKAKPVSSAVQPLLSADLVVQASLAQPQIEAGGGSEEALRLRAAQAYGTS